MSGIVSFLAFVTTVAFSPLVFVTAKTASVSKLRERVFVRALVKDYLRTMPIVALVSLPALIFPSIVRPYAIGLHLVFALPLMLELGHVHLFGTRVGINTFYSLFVSNARETREYLSQNVGLLQLVLVGLVWLLPPFALGCLPQASWPSSFRQIVGCSLTGLVALPFVLNFRKRPEKRKDGYFLNPFANLIVCYLRFRTQYRELKKIIARHAAPPFRGIVSRIPADEPETYVIVIGESANAQHLHYCGYPRETNEFTDRLGTEMLRFKGVRSPFAQTIPSLERVLTFADAEHPDFLWTRGSVVDYFHDAGFETYWLSNQYALDDTALTALTAHADVSKCYNFSGMKRFEKAGLDEGLLPDFRTFIHGGAKKKVLFLHLIGSHSAYVNRYPDSFRHFDGQAPGRTLSEAKQRLLNAYDDSIRYTDWLVAELVGELKAVGGISYLLYFSDHGEDIYDSTDERILGHGPLANEPMTSVPFMLWTSPRLDELRGDIRARFVAETGGYSLDNAIHSIIDISSLSSADSFPDRSILAERSEEWRG